MKHEIIEVEEKLKEAMLNSDIASLDELLSSNLLFTNHIGVLVSKEEDLNAHATKLFEFSSLELSDYQIRALGSSAVVSVKAEIQGTYNQQPANGTFRFTRVWSNISGKWQVIAGHSCVIV